MAVRDGMQTLIDRTRKISNAGTAQYTVGSITYWSDLHLQDILDRFSTFVIDVTLTPRSQNIAGTINYLVYETRWRNFEEAESGSTRWAIRDSTGVEVGTANYGATYDQTRITFSANQAGSPSYYLTGYSFDVYGAAVEIVEDKIARVDEWYDFSASNQSFKRSQVIGNLESTLDMLRKMAGNNDPAHSGDVGTSYWFRVDVNV